MLRKNEVLSNFSMIGQWIMMMLNFDMAHQFIIFVTIEQTFFCV